MASLRLMCLVFFQFALAQDKSFDITVKAFTPKGLKIAVADDPIIKFVQFKVVLSNETLDYVGHRRNFAFHQTNGSWVYDNPDLETRVGYVVIFNYIIGTSMNDPQLHREDANHTSGVYLTGKGISGHYRYKVNNGCFIQLFFHFQHPQHLNNSTEFHQLGLTTQLIDCVVSSCGTFNKIIIQINSPVWELLRQVPLSDLEERKEEKMNKCFVITKVPKKDVCSDDVIFEDNFDVLNEENWRIEQYIPLDHPEYPFVSYQNLQGNDSTVFVENGHLHIRPKLQSAIEGFDGNSLYTGTLDLLSGCTGRVCKIHAAGPNILPPIVSGRISARSAFKYGTIHVRAKLPIGDWIYPEILLVPLNNIYGSLHYSSGVMKIAMARGNIELNKPKFSSNVLKGGPVLNSKCKGVFDFYSKETFDGRSWGDDFHVYSVTWSPGFIEMLVDGKSWVTYRPGSGGLRSWLPKACRGSWYKLLDRKEGTAKIAPFDDYFFVSFGVAVGGVFEFPDDLTTGDGQKKPWSNQDPRALVSFWDKREEWLKTWTQPKLIVDYVKIVAL